MLPLAKELQDAAWKENAQKRPPWPQPQPAHFPREDQQRAQAGLGSQSQHTELHPEALPGRLWHGGGGIPWAGSHLLAVGHQHLAWPGLAWELWWHPGKSTASSWASAHRDLSPCLGLCSLPDLCLSPTPGQWHWGGFGWAGGSGHFWPPCPWCHPRSLGWGCCSPIVCHWSASPQPLVGPVTGGSWGRGANRRSCACRPPAGLSLPVLWPLRMLEGWREGWRQAPIATRAPLGGGQGQGRAAPPPPPRCWTGLASCRPSAIHGR